MVGTLALMAQSAVTKFYRPAIWFLRLARSAGFPSPANPIVIAANTVLLLLAFVWLEISPGWLSGIAVASLAILEFLIAYINYAAVTDNRLETQRVWGKIAQLNRDATGNIAGILDRFSERHRAVGDDQTSADTYKQEMRDFQQHLLRHAIQVISTQVNVEVEPGTLSANWSLRGSDEHQEEFRVVRYDRNMADRRPNQNWKPIEEGRPGASIAFRDGQIALIEDTHNPDYEQYFPTPPSYRSVLSVPVICRESVIGVVNIDAAETGILNISQESLVMDIAYLVGLCEVLKDEHE